MDDDQSDIEELWLFYLEDGRDSLEQAEHSLLELQKNTSDKENISALFRSIHTYKGMSRMMGMTNIESISHYLEDLIGLVRDKGVELSKDIIDISLESVDLFRELLEFSTENRQDVELSQIEKLQIHIQNLIVQNGGEICPIEGASYVFDEESQEDIADIESTPQEEQVGQIILHEEPVDENGEPIFGINTNPLPVTDPVYLAVFKEVYTGEMAKLKALDKSNEDLSVIKECVEIILYASSQMNLDGFTKILENYTPEISTLDNLIVSLDEQYVAVSGGEVATETQIEDSNEHHEEDLYTSTDSSSEIEITKPKTEFILSNEYFINFVTEKTHALGETLNAFSSDPEKNVATLYAIVSDIKQACSSVGYFGFLETLEKFVNLVENLN